MLANRAKKNFRRLRGPLEKKGVGSFRVYDWDIPELRMAIDWYEGHLVCAEYARTQTDAIPNWLETMAAACASALEVPAERIPSPQTPRPSGRGRALPKIIEFR